jgi:hypothetical protein
MTHMRPRYAARFTLLATVYSGMAILTASHSLAQPIDPLADVPRGLHMNTDRASPGFVLFGPGLSGTTYLIDNDGQVVHTWTSEYSTGHGKYLLDNGNLIRLGFLRDIPSYAGGQGGMIQEFNWEGDLIWEYRLANERYIPHHDAAVLPNGNLLVVAWELKTAAEARGAGRRPDLLKAVGLWPDAVLELERRGNNEAEIVWEWHAWDHWIQDFDPNAPSYGSPSEHPELSDINSDGDDLSAAEVEELLALETVALVGADESPRAPDIMHVNGISYNPEFDQILLSVNAFNEIWIIDHSTTSEEAASHAGGRYGMGGDILYRWGNPKNYDRGDREDQILFGQHHARWNEAGLPGAGNITVFNNNFSGPEGTYSTIVEIDPPINSDGSYTVPTNGPFAPAEPVWTYAAPDKLSFRSHFISGAHRVPNGNTFIASGARGRFFEVTPEGDIVWEYWTPYSGDVGLPDDDSLARTVAPYFYETFRATRISPNHPALQGRNLTPLDPQPPLVPPPVLE